MHCYLHTSGIYPEADESSQHLQTLFFKNHFIIILPSTPAFRLRFNEPCLSCVWLSDVALFSGSNFNSQYQKVQMQTRTSWQWKSARMYSCYMQLATHPVNTWQSANAVSRQRAHMWLSVSAVGGGWDEGPYCSLPGSFSFQLLWHSIFVISLMRPACRAHHIMKRST
jgi:hypothetical protein